MGHDGIRRWVTDNAESFELFRTQLDDVRDLGGRVLAIGTIRIRGRGAGIETDVPFAGVFTIRDGRVSKWEDFRDRGSALAAVGLAE
jgi:ketosteroid isomerase-like protein